jgi:K+-sensing histidine kinase KdpD
MNRHLLPSQSESPKHAPDVRDIVSTIVRSLQTSPEAAAIRFEMDVPQGLDAPRPEKVFTQAVDQLIRYAIKRCDGDGELLVSARVRRNQIDFEVADTGAPLLSTAHNDSEQLTHSNFLPREFESARRLIASIGGKCQAANCPQGGVAWTINLPHLEQSQGNQAPDK